MKKQKTLSMRIAFSIFLLSAGLYTIPVNTKDTSDASIEKILDQKLNNSLTRDHLNQDIAEEEIVRSVVKNNRAVEQEKTIDINYNDADLIDVINRFAQLRGVNIILPTGANIIKSKLTLQMGERLSIEQVWKLLYTIVDIAGYSLIKRLDAYVIVKTDKDIARRAMPIYIGVAPQDLPSTNKRIRYLYYLSNIQVPNIGSKGDSELHNLLSHILPQEAITRYMPSSNGLLIVEQAHIIKAAMKVVLEFDKVGFKENLEVIKLRYSTADIVAEIFNKNILPVAQPRNRRRLGSRGKSKARYFPKSMKIIAEPRTNTLILLGRQQAIDRVKEFIFSYIDVNLGSGKSILHTYKLQYLDAEPFVKTLESIVASAAGGGTGQSRASGKAKGPERFFDGVIIKTDTPPSKKGEEKAYAGSNQLIIAARNDDWKRIKKLIEKLDRPQPQVIIEVLIADIQINDDRLLGSHTRNPKAMPLPEFINSESDVQFQSAQTNVALASKTDGGLQVDLLQEPGFTPSAPNTVIIPPFGATLSPGAGFVSLSDSDGKTWSILQVLQRYENSKILSHPHIVATNNQLAKVVIGEIRLVRGPSTSGQAGVTTAQLQEKEASLKVNITPRISGGNTVNLQVSVILNEFIGDVGNQIDRSVITNANVLSGSILALGGLIKINTSHGLNATPILGRIPLIGWLFKKKSSEIIRNNLTVFIRPTIVQPRLRGGIDTYTRDYINVAKQYVKDGMLFDTLRDPITRWFFRTGVSAEDAIDAFAQESPQGRSVGLSSIELASNNVPMPVLQNNSYCSPMAAAEGRCKPGKIVQEIPVLAMKNELMDYIGETKTVVATNKSKKRRTKGRKKVAARKQKVVAVEKHAKRVPVSRDDQLKQILSGENNPLLS